MSKSRDLGWYLSDQAVQAVVPFALTPIYTRFIAPDEFGVQYMFSIVLTIGLGVANLGLPYAYERFFFHYPAARRERLLGTVVGASAALVVGLSAAVWLFRAPLAAMFVPDPAWRPMLLLVVLIGGLSHLLALVFADLRNRRQVKAFVVHDLIRLLAGHAIGLVLVIAMGWGIWGQLTGALASQALIAILFLGRFGPVALCRIDVGVLRDCLAFGWPMMARNLLNVVGTTVDKYLIGATASLAMLGLYGKAMAWSAIVFAFMTTVENVYMPLWNRKLYGHEDAPPQSVSQLFSEYCAVCALPCAAFVIFAPEVIRLLTPSPYHAAIPLTALLAFAQAIKSYGKLMGSVNAYLKLVKFSAAMGIVGSLTTVGLNLLLIPVYGSLGAVAAILIVTVGLYVVTALVVRRHLGLDLEVGYLASLYGALLLGASVAVAGYNDAIPYGVDLAIRIVLTGGLMALVLRRIPLARIRATVRHLSAR